MKGNEQRRRRLIFILALLLAVHLLLLAGIVTARFREATPVAAPGNLITPEKRAASWTYSLIPMASAASRRSAETTLSLHAGSADVDSPFQVVNMFPGDRETKSFCVEVHYEGVITVHFRADVREGYEKLAEVLQCKVVLLDAGEVLYEGLMGDMPKSVDHVLRSDRPAEEMLVYEVTAWLDTSVGNDYMNKELIADFHWWVVEDGQAAPNEPENVPSFPDEPDTPVPPGSPGNLTPDTGDDFPFWLWAPAAAGSLAAIVLLLFGKRREETRDET